MPEEAESPKAEASPGKKQRLRSPEPEEQVSGRMLVCLLLSTF